MIHGYPRSHSLKLKSSYLAVNYGGILSKQDCGMGWNVNITAVCFQLHCPRVANKPQVTGSLTFYKLARLYYIPLSINCWMTILVYRYYTIVVVKFRHATISPWYRTSYCLLTSFPLLIYILFVLFFTRSSGSTILVEK